MDYNLIPVETVKAITGATDDAVATQQGAAIIGMLQSYLGLVIKKQDFTAEKITVPYHFSRVIRPKYAPINSVREIGIITNNGTYKADNTDNPAPLTVAFRKTILACSKKSAFPFRAHRVHFTVLRQANSQRLFTSLVSGFSGYFSRSSHL